jgi:hypothetical protein
VPTDETEYDSLLNRYVRLRRAAEAVVDGAEAIGNPEEPRAGIPAHVLRQLRREITGEPAPSTMPFATISPGS